MYKKYIKLQVCVLLKAGQSDSEVIHVKLVSVEYEGVQILAENAQQVINLYSYPTEHTSSWLVSLTENIETAVECVSGNHAAFRLQLATRRIDGDICTTVQALLEG